jgi:hypothetical protein
MWIRWQGGIEIRNDGFTIYHDPRFVMLRTPDGRLKKFRTPTEAKRNADSIIEGNK